MTIKQTGGIFGRNPTFNDVDIDGDLTVAGDLTVQGTTITVDSATAQSIVLGDNDKMTFGDGPDLEIYSDGTTGQIAGNVNVTGTITSDGLTVESATGAEVTLKNTDSDGTSGEYVGKLHFEGSDSSSGASGVRAGIYAQYGSSFGYTSLDFLTSISGGSLKKAMSISGDGDISFYEDTGTTPKMVWSASAESLGIGTSSPSATLDVRGSGGALPTTNSADIAYFSKSGSGGIQIISGTTGAAFVGFGDTDSRGRGAIVYDNFADSMYFSVAASEAMRIDSSGLIQAVSSIASDPTNTNAYWYNKSGVGPTLSGFRFSVRTGATPTEAFRVDESGNLLVGKTAINTNVVGVEFKPAGQVLSTADGTNPLFLNRKTSDGEIVRIAKDGTTVGSIGVYGGPYFAGTAKGIRINSSSITPSTNLGVNSDALVDIGASTVRFKDLYLSGGITNTAGEKAVLHNGAQGSFYPSVDANNDLGSSSNRWMNAYLSGGVYLGGTGAANLLDDYETGTWTPVVADAITGGNTAAGGTFTGTYVKVGKVVTLQVRLVGINTTGMTSGNLLYVRNLPFLSSASNSAWGYPTFQNVSFTGQPSMLLGDSRTHLYFREFSSGGTLSDLLVSDFTSGSADVFFQLSYEV